MVDWKTKFIGTPTYSDLNNFFSIDLSINETKTFGSTNNNLQRLFVGNEILDDKNVNIDFNIDFNLPDLIDFGFNIPDMNIDVKTGYIYFNLEIQQLGFSMWRGVKYLRFPDRNMIFPSGYRLSNGNIYWGTDIEVGWITSLVQRSIKLTGSTERDILAEFGIYDQQFIDFLKNFVYNAYNLMKEYTDWYNHLADNSNTLSVAIAVNTARQIFNALSQYNIQGIVDIAKQKLGDAYEYVKDPNVIISIGLTYAIDALGDAIVGALGLSEGIAVILGFMLYSAAESIMDGVKKWNEWKQTNGDNVVSFAKFLTNYFNPTPENPIDADNFWGNWAEHVIESCSAIANFLGISKNNYTWEDFLNEISKLAPQLITEDLKFTVDYTFEYTLVNCNYGFAKYDGWFFPKYHIYKAYNLQPSNYKLCGMIPLPNGDVFLREIELTKDNINAIFNKPNFPLLMLKTWKGTYALLSQVIENEGITKFVIGSTFPSYLQMKAYNILKIRIE
ncbi:MAG: hypothetical protein GXN95_05805 [Methanococci archaeon]|nr:hypothetical protein [Methanococci archaeon]